MSPPTTCPGCGEWRIDCNMLEQCARYATAYGPAAGPRDPNGRSAHQPGAKLDGGKLQPDLILSGFANALTAVAEIGTHGAEKYTRDGWSSVPDGIYRYRNAGQRHALARATGEHADPDSGLAHLAHEAWNKLAELELTLRGAESTQPNGEWI